MASSKMVRLDEIAHDRDMNGHLRIGCTANECPCHRFTRANNGRSVICQCGHVSVRHTLRKDCGGRYTDGTRCDCNEFKPDQDAEQCRTCGCNKSFHSGGQYYTWYLTHIDPPPVEPSRSQRQSNLRAVEPLRVPFPLVRPTVMNDSGDGSTSITSSGNTRDYRFIKARNNDVLALSSLTAFTQTMTNDKQLVRAQAAAAAIGNKGKGNSSLIYVVPKPVQLHVILGKRSYVRDKLTKKWTKQMSLVPFKHGFYVEISGQAQTVADLIPIIRLSSQQDVVLIDTLTNRGKKLTKRDAIYSDPSTRLASHMQFRGVMRGQRLWYHDEAFDDDDPSLLEKDATPRSKKKERDSDSEEDDPDYAKKRPRHDRNRSTSSRRGRNVDQSPGWPRDGSSRGVHEWLQHGSSSTRRRDLSPTTSNNSGVAGQQDNQDDNFDDEDDSVTRYSDGSPLQDYSILGSSRDSTAPLVDPPAMAPMAPLVDRPSTSAAANIIQAPSIASATSCTTMNPLTVKGLLQDAGISISLEQWINMFAECGYSEATRQVWLWNLLNTDEQATKATKMHKVYEGWRRHNLARQPSREIKVTRPSTQGNDQVRAFAMMDELTEAFEGMFVTPITGSIANEPGSGPGPEREFFRLIRTVLIKMAFEGPAGKRLPNELPSLVPTGLHDFAGDMLAVAVLKGQRAAIGFAPRFVSMLREGRVDMLDGIPCSLDEVVDDKFKLILEKLINETPLTAEDKEEIDRQICSMHSMGEKRNKALFKYNIETEQFEVVEESRDAAVQMLINFSVVGCRATATHRIGKAFRTVSKFAAFEALAANTVSGERPLTNAIWARCFPSEYMITTKEQLERTFLYTSSSSEAGLSEWYISALRELQQELLEEMETDPKSPKGIRAFCALVTGDSFADKDVRITWTHAAPTPTPTNPNPKPVVNYRTCLQTIIIPNSHLRNIKVAVKDIFDHMMLLPDFNRG